MPNTPCFIQEGMTSLTPNKYIIKDELKFVQNLFNCFSKTEIVSEDLIHAVIGVSGSAPAYVYIFIEAMAYAGVAGG